MSDANTVTPVVGLRVRYATREGTIITVTPDSSMIYVLFDGDKDTELFVAKIDGEFYRSKPPWIGTTRLVQAEPLKAEPQSRCIECGGLSTNHFWTCSQAPRGSKPAPVDMPKSRTLRQRDDDNKVRSVDDVEAALDRGFNRFGTTTLLYFIARILIEWYRFQVRRDYEEWQRRNG